MNPLRGGRRTSVPPGVPRARGGPLRTPGRALDCGRRPPPSIHAPPAPSVPARAPGGTGACGMNPFFRNAATALAALSLLVLVTATVAALVALEGGPGALSVMSYAAMGYVFLMVGYRAYQRAAHVAAGPAFLIHASSWALLLSVYLHWQAGGGRPAAAPWYVVFALGSFLHAPSLLHFAAALAFPRRVTGWLPWLAAFYAVVLGMWVASVAGVFAGMPGTAAVLDGTVRDRGLDLAAFWG